MTDDIVIHVDKVSKDFRLPHEKVDSIKSVFVNPFRASGGRIEVQHALKNITFDIKKGEFFGIVGRNGSGKSTLLKIIAGIYQPTKGTVNVTGRLVPFIELGVGFNPELTGRENVYLNGALMGFSVNEVNDKYHAIVEFAELERFMDQKLKNYSSGMQVRLAFSVATVLAESDVLLIDEVLAVGDADFQRKCFDYFKKLKKDKKTVIFVSHDMGAVREYCDRAILIDKSEIVFSGTANATAKEYTRLFLPDVYEAQQSEVKKVQNKGKWGAGGIDIQNVTTNKKVYTQDDESLTIKYAIKANKGFNGEIMAGFAIKNGAGELLCGTNNKIVGYEGSLVFDENTRVLHVEWIVPNIFNEGNYSVEPAVDSIDTSQLLQWWDDAHSFKVVNDYKTPYPVAPRVQFLKR